MKRLSYMLKDWLFGHTSHDWEFVDFYYHSSRHCKLSASPVTAKIYKCRCGEEKRELTEAGSQQVFEFGDNMIDVLGVSR